MKSNEEETESLEGLGDLLPAEVLKEYKGSIVFNIYIGGALPQPLPKGRGDNTVKKERALPDVLSSKQAMTLWQKAQEAGFVDDNLQPLISRTQAALLADAMAMRLGIKEKWKVFEALWNRKNMYRDYYKALSLQQSLTFQDKIKKLFR